MIGGDLKAVVAGGGKDKRLCVHGTYKKNLESILAFGLKHNKVILTESIDSIVSVDYFQKIESWPNRLPVHF
ncbi:hypothetical protein IGI04_006591 [Brassica rapa subsp. trilocularis]|uniref:Uncharacterized protein n=1 Tax=Brassica rapa subsp. trilocularis TaxID=1813537 RepID=A0ABQ7NHB5_BRACM|nr:hypothetical protein IGI04_006591 [Brassica rapa subsp. trilocularis]